MTTAEFKALERVFEADIAGSLNDSPRIFQSRAKVFRRLAEQGLIEEIAVVLGGRFPVRITGWMLTLKGHMTYCQACETVGIGE